MKSFAVIVSAALAFEDVMHEIASDEHLQLLQLSARRHEETQPFDASGYGDGGPYEILGFGQECPDDQLLTLHQCAEAVWTLDNKPGNFGALNLRGPHSYGPISQGDGPRGCWYAKTRSIYYNAMPTGKAHRNRKPICGVNGGRLAETQLDQASLPADGVELQAVNTVCDECGLLTNEQCQLAGKLPQLGIKERGGASGFGIYQSNKNGTIQGGKGPAACFKRSGLLYFNFDTAADDAEYNVPHPKRQPICGVCPTTTTTAPTEAPPAPPPSDAAEAVGDPHITTNTGRHFDVEQ
jgi:hypothetical protein